MSNFLGDRTNQVRDPVSVYAASISNPAGHSFSVAATGLPAGLTIDPGTDLISGTVADNADTGSPYHVTVTVVDATYGAAGKLPPPRTELMVCFTAMPLPPRLTMRTFWSGWARPRPAGLRLTTPIATFSPTISSRRSARSGEFKSAPGNVTMPSIVD